MMFLVAVVCVFCVAINVLVTNLCSMCGCK